MRARLAVLCWLALAGSGGCTFTDGPATGPWRAWLDSPGGELPFGLELERDGEAWRAALLNGSERIDVPEVTVVEGFNVTLAIPHYDAMIVASVEQSGRAMHGTWTKTGVRDTIDTLKFHATAGRAPRFVPAVSPPLDAPDISGRWRVQFARDDYPSIGEFHLDERGVLTGTFLNVNGDYRYLAGDWDGTTLRLSCFDGAHAFLFRAQLQPDGRLHGEFWSRAKWHETWTAERAPDAELADPFEQTRWVEELALSAFRYPDVDGVWRALDDPAFAGRARVIELFGTWCPNCDDAADFVAELERRYADRGLSILGLAFEHTDDFERSAEQVRRYKAHHGIEHPVLIAGSSDKALASDAFPLVDRVRAYPTFIFLDGENRVRAVYHGFTGPAAGDEHARLRERFETLIEGLLAG